jgi:hypothetical protein
MANVFGSEFRRVENREHLGKPALVAVLIRSYDTTVEDLWDAITTPERLTLEHIAHKDGIGEEHLKKFGPGAVGIGWDLGFHGLERHLAAPDVPLDHAAMEAWSLSAEGKAFTRSSGDAWAAAHAASGEDPEEARAKAERTIAFYQGA